MIADRTAQLRAETYGDWLGLAYRALFYGLAATPIWGAGIILSIIWHRTQF